MTHRPASASRGLAHLADALDALERQGLRRRPRAKPTHELERTTVTAPRSFCSNDYLGLARRLAPQVETGAGASRLIAGEHPAHHELEQGISAWLGVEATLAFSSGYAANLGTIAALASPTDLIVSDALNHASLIDGARLSQARIVVTPHNDVRAIETALRNRQEARAWVIVESYYSMDADGPDLRHLRAVCDEHGAALLVDEAHAIGVLGPVGRGRCAEAGVSPDVLVGTLGKAFGSQGAFVGGSSLLRDWLWNRARSFVFSTGLSPMAAAAAGLALEHIRTSAEGRDRVRHLSTRLREGLGARGSAGEDPRVIGFGHIVPIVIGDTHRTQRLAELLAAEGLVVPAIRPPTVPAGTARLRLTVTASHAERDVDRAVDAVRTALGKLA